MKITKESVLNIIGILLIVFSILRIYTMITQGTWIHIFWLCNHIPLLIGITILYRNSFWLTAEFSLLFIGSLNWTLDFLSKLLFGKYLLGSTAYIFATISTESAVSIFLHLSVLPLALLAFFLIKENPAKITGAWQGSLLHMFILIPFILYFGKIYNLNCLLKSCIEWLPSFSFYPFVFFIIYLGLFVIPINCMLMKLLEKCKSNNC